MKQIKLEKNQNIIPEMNMSQEVYTHQKKPFFLKKWWGMYIKRLNKVTKGKSQKCC